MKRSILALFCIVLGLSLTSFTSASRPSAPKDSAQEQSSVVDFVFMHEDVPFDSLFTNPNASDSVLLILLHYVVEMKSFQVYNDSMYMGLDSAQWIPFFKRRASLLSQFYRINGDRIRTIKKLLDATRESDIREFSDTMAYIPDFFLLTNARCRMILIIYHLCFYGEEQGNDAFLFEDLLEYIGPDIEKYMPHSVYAYLYYSALTRCKYLVATVAGDQSLEEAWHYNQKVLDLEPYAWEYAKLEQELVFPYSMALYNSLDLRFAYDGVATLDEMRANVPMVERELDAHIDYYTNEDNVSNYKNLRRSIETFPLRMLTQYVWKDNYDYHSSVTDSAAQVYIDRIEKKIEQKKVEVPMIDSINMWKMQVYLGQLSPDEALVRTYRYDTAHVFNHYHDVKRSNLVGIFAWYLFPLVYFNDRSTLPESEKQKVAAEVARQMVLVLRVCKNAQAGDVKALIASHYLTLPILINHLTLAERQAFLDDMVVSCQVQTVTHSRMVGLLSRTLLEGVISYEPELLEGLPQVPSLKKLKRDKAMRESLLDFVQAGGNCHDLGKITMAEIVRNDFRPLTDHEFEILKTHPQRGMPFLFIDPSKSKLRDLVVGHHKWYNGSRGYPDSYDPVHSKYRILVDIVTISDCLEAATDQLGRRYSNAKKFDMMMQEFRSGAGTRYNADLVRLIDAHPDVADSLRYMVEQGWYGNYYEIYHKYFSESYEDALENAAQ